LAGRLGDPGASVTSRVLAILGTFDEEHREQSLTEIADRSRIPLSTSHRLVTELVEWGALRRRTSGRYVVGRRLWRIGLLSPAQTGLREVASPFLHDIYAATLATVHLAVRDGLEVLYLDRLSGTASVPVVSRVGSRLPLHCTGVGKVLLAYAPEDVVAGSLRQLTKITPYTLTQPGQVLAQLDRARREGYAQTVEEMSLGACSLAVPIRHPSGAVVAALGVVVPSLKRDKGRLIAALQVAAAGIGRSLAA
jgi:DNA-binding IclR family transcriptional regulator